MNMIDSFEPNKQRDIVFSAEPPGQVERAYQLLSGLPDCKVEHGNTPNTLRVSYNLHDYTLEGLENGLTEQGFHLDHNILHKMGIPLTHVAPVIRNTGRASRAAKSRLAGLAFKSCGGAA